MELFDGRTMPLSSNDELRLIQEKVINGEKPSIFEMVKLGRDRTIKILHGYELKKDHVYRAISEEMLMLYQKKGFVLGVDKNDEYQEFINNKGVDWYLGGTAIKYGNIIIECPADKDYFMPTIDNGCGLSTDITVRHMKSSGYLKPVPFSMITKIIVVVKDKNKKTDNQIKEEIKKIIELDEQYKMSKDSYQCYRIKSSYHK